MRIALLILPWAALGVAAAIAAAGAAKGKNIFKNQAVAWLLTIVMVVVAIGVGYAKAPHNNSPAPEPGLQQGPGAYPSYVRDDANALSAQTERALYERNLRLYERHSVTIGVVTCDNAEDLGEYAMKCAEDMGLGGYDFIVALDIRGENYWLVQGDDIRRDFTDEDCSDYAYDYMEKPFARGDYDNAVLSLTDALERWYGDYFD